jgi:hypothetical protein
MFSVDRATASLLVRLILDFAAHEDEEVKSD